MLGFWPSTIRRIALSTSATPLETSTVTDYDVEGVKRALSEASPERKPEWRAKQKGAGKGQ